MTRTKLFFINAIWLAGMLVSAAAAALWLTVVFGCTYHMTDGLCTHQGIFGV